MLHTLKHEDDRLEMLKVQQKKTNPKVIEDLLRLFNMFRALGLIKQQKSKSKQK